MMFEELLHHPVLRESPDAGGLPILLVFGMLRDDFPWLYELGVQLYRAIEEGNPRAIDRARKTLMNTLEMTTHGPFMHEMLSGEDEEAIMFLDHFLHEIDRFILKPKRLRKAEPPPDRSSPG